MNREQYLEYFRTTIERMYETTKAKNQDYSAGDNPFFNFEIAEMMGVSTAEAGFFVRIMDKMSRLRSFIQKGVLQVKDEAVEDSLIDAAVYLIMLSAYIKSKK